MRETAHKAIAIVGVGAVLPDAPDVPTFWSNVKSGRYSIAETPPERWDTSLYYDADPKTPDKTYSKIGGWVRQYPWDPIAWKLPIPPRVSDNMDRTQKWAVAATREALADYGWPARPLDPDRTAVVLGNAMAGDRHYMTALRLFYPEYAQELAASLSFAVLPAEVRQAIEHELHAGIGHRLPEINEDTMPGELANIIAGRVANLFNFHGPNFVVDAACASAMAAIGAAIEGLEEDDFDAVITGGIDANMSASTFIKFCKIGALSATGTRPYADGADGFVMGEGAAVFLLKRLEDAERDGDKIYAVIRGVGGSSDGRGKGITAPNPAGQRLAVERAWEHAGVSPATAGLIEGHGTSTRVGDVAEVESLNAVFGGLGLPAASIPLGSVKSNIGHLKGAAGAAGILKTALALHEKVLPPSLNCGRPNPNIDFAGTPFYVNTELRPWEIHNGDPRRAGVSAFGFGGTNFHTVLEEYVPGMEGGGKEKKRAPHPPAPSPIPSPRPGEGEKGFSSHGPARANAEPRTPLRGALVLGGASLAEIGERLRSVEPQAPAPPRQADLAAPVRLAIDYDGAAELAVKSDKVLRALDGNHEGMWRALRAQGIFRGAGPAPKVAFLYTGQGSQYLGMLGRLRETEPIVAETFAEADRVMTPILGKPLSDFLFVPEDDPEALARAEKELRQTAITQPAVLAVDIALTRLMASYGIVPDMVMGHSLGEYGALVAAGSLSFAEALEAVAARGREMTNVSVADHGRMIAVMAPLDEIERTLASIDGYAVVANINSTAQAVVGGSTPAVTRAEELFRQNGREVRPLPVSHAFHTTIVAPASEPLRRVLERLDLRPPQIPIVSNATGGFYPMVRGVVPEMIDLLARQIASPVQFVQGLETLYGAGARVFVEVGPKRALHGFVEDVLGRHDHILALFTNHPKAGDLVSFNQALCGLYAAGLGNGTAERPALQEERPMPETAPRTDRYNELGRLFADFLDRGMEIYQGGRPRGLATPATDETVVLTGAAVGLPGPWKVFDDANVGRILRGEQALDAIPMRLRKAMAEKNITRLVKTREGDGRFESISSPADVIKLAARAGELDLARDYGIPEDRLAAFDRTTRLAIAAGLDALRDAGIPLVMRYKTATTGARLPDRWGLPDSLRDDTGVIFASAFPGYDSLVGQIEAFHRDRTRREKLAELEDLRSRLAGGNGITSEIDRRIHDLRAEIEREPFTFDRRFLFQVLSMGHSQLAELIGARGPNTQINAACASTTQAFALAADWIRLGRCRRVVVVAADDITSDNLLGWFGSGFLASGAAATDELVEDAALPFDQRRHGLLIGMGAAAAVLESAEAARERGLRPICELLSAVTANSAFHGSRLDVHHIGDVMEKLVSEAEARWGLDRHEIAPQTVFLSHETYTPARGGSAQAEVNALRQVFGAAADRVVVANTKGFTGHPMGVGVEDVVAIKSLETGLVPPVANIKERDPEFTLLNLSRGGAYPIRYALRLGAGFGSQISMTLLRWVPSPDGSRRAPDELGYAYRVEDPATWKAWLAGTTGDATPELEVVHRTLRVVDRGAAKPVPAKQAEARPSPPGPLSRSVPPPSPGEGEVKTAPAPVSAPPPVALAAESSAGDAIRTKVLEIVSRQTGYPLEMLALDLDLEADLGIDTVKQAETFAAIRAAWDIPREENLKLRDFPTLGHCLQFVYDRRPDLKPATASSALSVTASPSPGEGAREERERGPGGEGPDEVTEAVLALIAEKTGYPREMLELDLDLEADLGVDTVKQAEMFAAIRGLYDIPRDEKLKLRDFPTLKHTIQFVYDRRPDLKPAPQGKPDGGAPTSVLPLSQPSPSQGEEAPAPATPPWTASPSPGEGAREERERGPGGEGPDEVTEAVLALIAEKTGYPREMLELDLDLEADLGVDTVKQAEMFAAIRGLYDIPRDENLKLRDFPTLKHTIQFVYDRRPDLRPAPQGKPDGGAPTSVLPLIQPSPSQGEEAPAPAAPAVIASPSPGEGAREERERGPGGEGHFPRRIPAPVLRPPLDLCKPTGVALGPDSRVVVAFDQGGVGKALAGRLAKLGAEVLSVEGAPAAADLEARLREWSAQGPVQGVYWLPALDREPETATLDLAAWREELRVRAKLLYTTLRTLYEDLARPGAFLVTATRLGGRHGYDDAGAFAPMGGAVTGLAKSFQRERPGCLVKAVDFPASRQTSSLADALLDETLRDPGAVEIGRELGKEASRRWTIGLIEQPAAPAEADEPGMTLGPDSVFVVTGAAGSIVSAIVTDLTKATAGGTFHLLDLAPEPDPADPDLARFTSDREGLKRDLFERLKARGERATPALVEKELARIERLQAALAAIQAVQAAGGTVHYHRVDLRDAAAVGKAFDQVRSENGRVDVLLHAAGLEISRLLPDKQPEELDLVFDVKADGWFNLIAGIGDLPLGAAVAFSSIAGRFGNGGQADYSAANDLLCKQISGLRRTRPATRGLAIDWTAWGGIGMATRGSIPKVMEAAGIDMLPPAVGIPLIRQELLAGGFRGEIVVAGRLGIMLAERDATGGLDTAALEERGRAAGGVMVGRVQGMSVYGGLTVETLLDPAAQPFLDHHRIDGTPVLPGVMGIEAFAEAAALPFPDLRVAAVEDVRFLAPFKFYRGEPRAVTVEALFRPDGQEVVADCRLLGSRQLPGAAEPQVTTHFTARVRLSPEPAGTETTGRVPVDGAVSRVGADDVYRIYFHGPAYRVLESAWKDGGEVAGRLARSLPPNHRPEALPTLMEPRLLELCFQTAGIGELGTRGRMALPLAVESVRVLRHPEPEAPLYAVTRRVEGNGNGHGDGVEARVVDEQGNLYVALSGYRTVELPGGVDPSHIAPLKAAMEV